MSLTQEVTGEGPGSCWLQFEGSELVDFIAQRQPYEIDLGETGESAALVVTSLQKRLNGEYWKVDIITTDISPDEKDPDLPSRIVARLSIHGAANAETELS